MTAVGEAGGARRRMGFFTDTTLCIGCKACEVACKEWNLLGAGGGEFTGDSYDNTGALGASTWRHVAFIEQSIPAPAAGGAPMRWLMSSDVCKHCAHAACLDVCPTGAIIRTEFGSVLIQDDICNGCGYCVAACPFGVIGRSAVDGGAHKCTLCYDRLRADLQPACATACPTTSIRFGPLEELRTEAGARLEELHQRGEAGARLYGDDPGDGVGGMGAFFLLLDDPEVYGLPPDPVTSTRDLGGMWRAAGAAAMALAAGVAVSLAGSRRG